MHAFVWGGSVWMLCWMVWFLISLIRLKIVFCGLYNNGDGFWLSKFCLWLLSIFGLLLIWCSSILLLLLCSTLSRSSRILANFNLFSASSKFSNISALSSSCCSLNSFSYNFNFSNFLSALIFSWSANNSAFD